MPNQPLRQTQFDSLYESGNTEDERSTFHARATNFKKNLQADEEIGALIAKLGKDERNVFWTTETCERFLLARNFDEAKATAMMKECLEWRTTYKPFEVKAEDVNEILKLGTTFICGRCKAGRPVLYMSPGMVNPFPAETRVKLMVFLMEETFRRGHTKLTWVFDFSKMGQRGKDDEVTKTRHETMKILQNYYPERLGALHMLNTPWYFRVVAALVWPFLNARTASKIHIKCSLEDLLTKVVDKDELIVEHGGNRVFNLDNSDPFGA